MVFDFREDGAGYHSRGFGAAGSEARPVIEVDDRKRAVGEYDGIASEYLDIEGFCRAGADLFELVVVKLRLAFVGSAGLA